MAVAMVILGIALVGLIRLYTQGLVVTGRAERRMVATALARAKIEELRHMPELETGADDGRTAEPYEAYGWRTEIQDMSDLPGLKHVLVTTMWLEGQEERSVMLETFLPEPAPPEEEAELPEGPTGEGQGSPSGAEAREPGVPGP